MKNLDLVNFLKSNLTPKEFSVDEDSDSNHYICYDGKTQKFYIEWTSDQDIIGAIYFEYEGIEETVDMLNDNEVTLKEFKKTLKILDWI